MFVSVAIWLIDCNIPWIGYRLHCIIFDEWSVIQWNSLCTFHRRMTFITLSSFNNAVLFNSVFSIKWFVLHDEILIEISLGTDSWSCMHRSILSVLSNERRLVIFLCFLISTGRSPYFRSKCRKLNSLLLNLTYLSRKNRLVLLFNVLFCFCIHIGSIRNPIFTERPFFLLFQRRRILMRMVTLDVWRWINEEIVEWLFFGTNFIANWFWLGSHSINICESVWSWLCNTKSSSCTPNWSLFPLWVSKSLRAFS